MPLAEFFITPIMIGLSHSVESDHVVAVGNLVSVKHRLLEEAIRGASWGFGHTASVMIFAFTYKFIKNLIGYHGNFSLELLVGLMMVIIGIARLIGIFRKHENHNHDGKRIWFFNVGLIHGLAGSGAIAALLSSTIQDPVNQFLFLSLFGLGTIIGMGAVTAFFTRLKFLKTSYLSFFTCIFAGLSILYGIKIIFAQTI